MSRHKHIAHIFKAIALQNDLLTRIGGMVSQFASRKADAVSEAIDRFSLRNCSAAEDLAARSQQLHDLALSAKQSLKVAPHCFLIIVQHNTRTLW
jgi:hypothetical protein